MFLFGKRFYGTGGSARPGAPVGTAGCPLRPLSAKTRRPGARQRRLCQRSMREKRRGKVARQRGGNEKYGRRKEAAKRGGKKRRQKEAAKRGGEVNRGCRVASAAPAVRWHGCRRGIAARRRGPSEGSHREDSFCPIRFTPLRSFRRPLSPPLVFPATSPARSFQLGLAGARGCQKRRGAWCAKIGATGWGAACCKISGVRFKTDS